MSKEQDLQLRETLLAALKEADLPVPAVFEVHADNRVSIGEVTFQKDGLFYVAGTPELAKMLRIAFRQRAWT